MNEESSMMSKKLVAAIVTMLCSTAAFFLGDLQSLHYAAIMGTTSALYIGGQALVDAAAKFAAAKYGSGK